MTTVGDEVDAVTATRVLVPVSDSVTIRQTVAYVSREARATLEQATDRPVLHFVYPISGRTTTTAQESREVPQAREILERIDAWLQEDLDEALEEVEVQTAIIGEEDYLFSPSDYADILVQYAERHNLTTAIFDPGFNPIGTTPLLPPLEAEVRRAGLDVQEAPVQRERRTTPLVRRSTLGQLFVLFSTTFVFYLLLAGSINQFELLTGGVSAGVVAIALWRVSINQPLNPIRVTRQFLRLLVYVPYLLWEITKANIQIAYVVLHPDLPIDPEMVEFDAAVWDPLPVTTLANSITLTPGTLTVDVARRHFTVHALTTSSKRSLLSGGLERGVRFVFYGIRAARIPSPIDRQTAREQEEEEA